MSNLGVCTHQTPYQVQLVFYKTIPTPLFGCGIYTKNSVRIAHKSYLSGGMLFSDLVRKSKIMQMGEKVSKVDYKSRICMRSGGPLLWKYADAIEAVDISARYVNKSETNFAI